jgi:hypothetical protein
VNLLYDHNVPPSVTADVIKERNGSDSGTFLPKTIFNINEKCRNLINIAQGIKPSWTDAEKIIRLLEIRVFLSSYLFYVVNNYTDM